MTANPRAEAVIGQPGMTPGQTETSEGTLTITSVFTLHDPLRQGELVELLAGNAVDILEHAPGFLGSTLSQSDDRTTVVHHATWASDASALAMLHSGAARSSVALVRQLATVLVVRSHRHTSFRPRRHTHGARQP